MGRQVRQIVEEHGVWLTPGWKWTQLSPLKTPSFSDVYSKVLSGLSSPLRRSR